MAIKCKTKEEINVLREGGKYLGEILSQLEEMLEVGLSTAAIDEEGRRLIEKAGARPAFLGYTPQGASRPYPSAVCVSINDEIVHGIPNEDPVLLQEGDVVTLDLGLTYDGLITDSALTAIVGETKDEDVKRLVQGTQEALMAGIKEVRVGNTIGDIGAAIEGVAKRLNLSVFRELVGHGVGYAVHEDPYVPNFGKPGSGERLEEGLVIAIEPMFGLGKSGIYTKSDGYTYATRDGSIAAHFEHTVVVTPDGVEILTRR